MNSTVVYSTSTDGTVYDARPEPLPFPVVREEVWVEFCFVCGRATDHFAEHDDRDDVVYESTEEQRGNLTIYTNYTLLK